MFTAKIIKKTFQNGQLKIEVQFTDGTDSWPETFSVSSEADLNSRISSRIDTLNGLEALSTSLTLGTWTKPVKEEYIPDPVQEALNKVYEAKGQLDAKLITEAEYDAVVLTYKTLASELVIKK